jgi:RNA polymerase sigma-70 factor (ECF subfamily)
MLRSLLLSSYEDFAHWLTRRLGSHELAREALQETYLRLERGNEIGPVHSPKAYLLRTAINIATNKRVADKRRLGISESERLLAIPDEAPDPARTVEARSELDALTKALNELPERRRQIFLASWIDEVSHREIADRFGISIRTVQIELKDALEHCAQRLRRKNLR